MLRFILSLGFTFLDLILIRPGRQVVRQGSAKPLYGGSIPPQASRKCKI